MVGCLRQERSPEWRKWLINDVYDDDILFSRLFSHPLRRPLGGCVAHSVLDALFGLSRRKVCCTHWGFLEREAEAVLLSCDPFSYMKISFLVSTTCPGYPSMEMHIKSSCHDRL